MRKSFYITGTIVVFVLFILFGLLFTPYDVFDGQDSVIENVSDFSVKLLSGDFKNNQINRAFDIICLIISAHLLYLVMRKVNTLKISLVMIWLYLATVSFFAYKTNGGAFTCLLSSFLIYVYYLRFDALIKWYIMLLTLAILALSYKVFLVAMYFFSLLAYFKIKNQKTAWTAFVNMILLAILAIFIHIDFINAYPLDLTMQNGEGLQAFFKNITIDKFIILFMFLCTFILFLISRKFVKGYVKFSALYTFLFIMSYMFFSHAESQVMTFLPPIFIGFSTVLSHLRIVRKNKNIYILTTFIITLFMFSTLLIFN